MEIMYLRKKYFCQKYKMVKCLIPYGLEKKLEILKMHSRI